METIQACSDDMLSGWVLQKHGQAILDEDYQKAERELVRFAGFLQCLDLKGLKFWDISIGTFLDAVATVQGSPDLSTCQAVRALWNPSLLVVDAIQHTGDSFIVDTFKKYGDEFQACLSGYPTESYGAALLDPGGTGTLIKKSGSMALQNLVDSLIDPTQLGLGMCPLSDHADEGSVAEVCNQLPVIEMPLTECTNESVLESVKNVLPTQKIAATPSPTGIGFNIGLTQSQEHFGSPLSSVLEQMGGGASMCSQTGSSKDSSRSLSPLESLAGPDSCILSFDNSKTNDHGSRILQCLDQQLFKGLEIQDVMYTYNQNPECQIGKRPGAPDDPTNPYMVDQSRSGKSLEEANKEANAKLRDRLIDGAVDLIPGGNTVVDGARQMNSWRKDYEEIKEVSRIEEYSETKMPNKPSEHELSKTHGFREKHEARRQAVIKGLNELQNKQTQSNPPAKQQTSESRPAGCSDDPFKPGCPGPDGKPIQPEKCEAKSKSKECSTTNESSGNSDSNSSTPTEPGEDQCGETEAMRRARLIFECRFGEEQKPPVLATLAPLINPIDSVPMSCEDYDNDSMEVYSQQWRGHRSPGVGRASKRCCVP